MTHVDLALIVIVASAIAAYAVRAYVRFARPGSVSDDIRADARRALNDTSRLVR